VAARAPRILPQGECGLVIELGDAISDDVNARVHALARAVREALDGAVEEVVPSYRALLVVHDPLRTPRAALSKKLAALAAGVPEREAPPPQRVVRVPVRYGGALGPDLEEAARLCGLPADELVALHTAPVYRVHMLGFTPGFPYLGGLDRRIAVPRLAAPRTRIPAGSVAVGGEQTGIYPVESPGGWRILGHTPLRLFDPSPGAARPFLLAAGDGLRFVPVDDAGHAAVARAVAAGAFEPELERPGSGGVR
jgi:KipI family sensor histidine kinase inhibitor